MTAYARTENHSVVRSEQNGLQKVVHVAIGEGWMIQVDGREIRPKPLARSARRLAQGASAADGPGTQHRKSRAPIAIRAGAHATSLRRRCPYSSHRISSSSDIRALESVPKHT